MKNFSLVKWSFFLVLFTLFQTSVLIGCPAGTNTESSAEKTGDGGTNPDGSGARSAHDDCNGNICTLEGKYTNDIKLTADKEYLLKGGVFVGQDIKDGSEIKAKIEIEAGTKIYADTSTKTFLAISRGSMIMAEGTKDKPIIFTSAADVGKRAPGDWGGLIINGKAKINAGKEAEGEGGAGYYGGEDDADNSGTLRYIRIEYGGKQITGTNELNGIALQGVGSGTTLEYLQIHMAKDDCIEFFGGTVNFKYILCTGSQDDGLDWTHGWRGKGQFFISQFYKNAGNNGIEADNLEDDNTATPRSKPTLSNLTLIGHPESAEDGSGMLLRRGTGANISNAVVLGWKTSCAAIDSSETFKNAWSTDKLNGELAVTNSYFSCATLASEPKPDKVPSPEFKVEDFIKTLNLDNKMEDPMLSYDPANDKAPGWVPKDGSPLLSGAKVPSDSFFKQVSFVGGAGRDADDWTQGWTTSEEN
ncbi:MAG: hypothetical protein H6728_13295 [Myxococcales bacterium]|nr:hypothetical protein [Myxococcales bacterium]MCB9644044.1 hypothetical protein [Myxococcales bacterium]